jgi:glycine/D-amino acid oxidase-like deaminating enzyme
MERVDARADVVVIGGGIAGLSAAYHLKKLEPKRRVVLVERDVLGGAASSRSASIV